MEIGREEGQGMQGAIRSWERKARILPYRLWKEPGP